MVVAGACEGVKRELCSAVVAAAVDCAEVTLVGVVMLGTATLEGTALEGTTLEGTALEGAALVRASVTDSWLVAGKEVGTSCVEIPEALMAAVGVALSTLVAEVGVAAVTLATEVGAAEDGTSALVSMVEGAMITADDADAVALLPVVVGATAALEGKSEDATLDGTAPEVADTAVVGTAAFAVDSAEASVSVGDAVTEAAEVGTLVAVMPEDSPERRPGTSPWVELGTAAAGTLASVGVAAAALESTPGVGAADDGTAPSALDGAMAEVKPLTRPGTRPCALLGTAEDSGAAETAG